MKEDEVERKKAIAEEVKARQRVFEAEHLLSACHLTPYMYLRCISQVKARQRVFEAEYRQRLVDDSARRQRLHDAVAREKYAGKDAPQLAAY